MTQKKIIQTSLFGTEKSIGELHSETGIRRPNIRRILGQGTKRGEFKKVKRGVYTYTTDSGEVRAYIYSANAVQAVPELAKEGFKADMIFLDIPYRTPATQTTNSNRGVKYPTIGPEQFFIILKAVKEIVRTPETPVLYMYSKARSGIKIMHKYSKMFSLHGFKMVAEGEYYKYQKDGRTRCRNMIGEIIAPEGIAVFNLSGKYHNLDLEYHIIRPKGYQTEKPIEMISSLIEQTTKPDDMIHDYFAGSGVVGEAALSLNRRCLLIDINSVNNWILPRLQA